jgi:hypothetical protein
MAEDQAMKSIFRLCNTLYQAGLRIVLCSGRSEEHRSEKVQWLKQQQLRLPKDGDRRSDVIVKRKLVGIDQPKSSSSSRIGIG